MGAWYAEGGAWLVTALANAGQDEEALRVGEDAAAVADKVLEVRPGYRLALHAEQVIEANLVGGRAGLARSGSRVESGSALACRSPLTLLKLDPKNVTSMNNLGVAHQSVAGALWARESSARPLPWYVKGLGDFNNAAAGGRGFMLVRAYIMADTAVRAATMGDFATAEKLVAEGTPFDEQVRKLSAAGQPAHRCWSLRPRHCPQPRLHTSGTISRPRTD